MEFNKYQTPLTKELIDTLTKEEYDDLVEFLTSVEFIKRLVAPDRKRAKDLPKDSSGKILVDITNPHILEDMDYFRESAIHFEKYGCYTNLKPNSNPNSAYGKWFAEELRRCWEGMIRPSDGEWITGKFYYYLNYSPIALSRIIPGTKIAERVAGFPEVWELTYLWSHYEEQARVGGLHDNFKGGKDSGIIARRGAGKSFYKASNGARAFNLGISKKVSSNVKFVIVAYEKEYLNRDGTLNKFVNMIDFTAEHTQFPSTRYKSSLGDMNWVMGYQDADTGVIKGTRNELLGISAKDNPDKVRGKRSHELVFEEFGMFPKFIDTWTTSEYNVREGEHAFGTRSFIGTGGTEGSDFEGAMEIITAPEAHYVYGLPNVFDKASQGINKTVLFLGAYLNRKGYYNKDGVSDVIGSLISILKERTAVKYNSTNPLLITQKKAEMPIILQEALMRRDSTIYPVSDLVEQVNRIDNNSRHWSDMWIGKLTLTGGTAEYAPDPSLEVIKDFPHKSNKLIGAVCIKELPKKNSEGLVSRGRYIAGIDTFDDDESETLSLGSIFILDLFTDELVFEYTGRDMFADDFYEICRRALLMYNAEANYENNKKGLFKYFSQHNALYLLSDVLQFLKDKEEVKLSYLSNKTKGTYATAGTKMYSRRCIRDWLLKPCTIEYKKIVNGEETIEEEETYSLYKIPFRALLRELITWNADGNFDRHDALGMLMLLREDKLRLFGGNDPKDSILDTTSKDYLGNDSFFKTNYEERFASDKKSSNKFILQ